MSFVDIELICLTYMRVLKESVCIVQSLNAFAHIPAKATHGEEIEPACRIRSFCHSDNSLTKAAAVP